MTAVATLPSGLVTFVFTDIEGSTKMFRRLGEGYPPILETHNRLLREQWQAYGGAEVKTVGDAFIVAFGSAADAMSASVAAQRAMADHPWPADATVRIRVGVHRGDDAEVEIRGDDGAEHGDQGQPVGVGVDGCDEQGLIQAGHAPF